MLDRDESRSALCKLFRRRMVAEIEVLCRTIGTNSRMSVFRRLREVGYLTSFTHGGRYYTLQDVPRFDDSGLWFFKGVGFSLRRTLKETLVHLVDHSPAGMSYSQLRRITSVRVENTLVLLAREGRIARQHVDGHSVYVAVDGVLGLQQIEVRRNLLQRTSQANLPLPLVVEILLEVVRAGGVFVDPKTVVARLVARGERVRLEDVETVYGRYGLSLEKKTGDVCHLSSSDR
jgi:hypothetical protein